MAGFFVVLFFFFLLENLHRNRKINIQAALDALTRMPELRQGAQVDTGCPAVLGGGR